MTVDDYLDAAPEPHAGTLRQIRSTLRELLPDATETISYNMPAFMENGKAIAGYAHFKNHCSFFPHSGSVLPELAEELDGYDWSAGTLRFPPDQPLTRSLLSRLVAVRRHQIDIR